MELVEIRLQSHYTAILVFLCFSLSFIATLAGGYK